MPPKKKGKGRGRGRAVAAESERTEPTEQPSVPREEIRPQRTQHRDTPSVTSAERAPVAQHLPTTSAEQIPSASARKDRRLAAAESPTSIPSGQSPAKPTEEAKFLRQKPAAKSVEKVTQQIGTLTLQQSTPKTKRVEILKRPGFGKDGRSIGLVANYFLLQCKKDVIYHYDVDIVFLRQRKIESEESAAATKTTKSVSAKGKPSLMETGRTKKEALEKNVSHVEHQMKRSVGKQRCREVITEMIKSKAYQQYSPVYDGQKNIYTIESLPFKEKQEFTITLTENDRYKDFSVVVKPVQKDDGSNRICIEQLRELYKKHHQEIPQEVIMAFDTTMCHRNPPFNQVQVGRSFFYLQQRRSSPLGDGLEIWYGYNQSIHLTQRGPAVVVNFSAKVFHKSGPVIDYVNDVLRKDVTKQPFLNQRDISILRESLSKVTIHVTHMKFKRKYYIKSVTDKSAKDIKLDIDGKMMSVVDYFRKTYGRELKYPHLPCLHMKSNTNTTFIPFEVCEVIPGQPKLGKLSGFLTSKMIRETAIPPAARFNKIMEEAAEINKVSGSIMNRYGINMSVKPMELRGRVLEAPSLRYKEIRNDDICRVAPDLKGVWKMDGKRFLFSRGNIRWVIISFSNCDQRVLSRFADVLSDTSRSVGLHLGPPVDIKAFDRRTTTEGALRYAKDRDVTFAVVILSSRDMMHSYEEVKFVAEFHLKLITQCMNDEVVIKKFNSQVANNVLLKINAKIGGVNHGLFQKPRIFDRPIIIMGADAAHSIRGSACPSIAAVVGSLDAFPSKYAVTCRPQENIDESKYAQEIIRDMEEMVKHVLYIFKQNTRGKNPEKVIFFRDGVSEGQFNTVLEEEVPSIQRACRDELGCIPPITYIIVQKRHQTRFLPQNSREGVGIRRGFKLKRLLGSPRIVTFAIKGQNALLLDKNYVISHLQSQGYNHWSVQSEFTKWSEDFKSTTKNVTSHHFLKHKNIIIHIVVFYEREQFLWHAKLPEITKKMQQELSIEETYLFTQSDSAYEKFEMTHIPDRKRNKNGLYVPSNPKRFLYEIATSKFLQCNHSMAKNFLSLYGQSKPYHSSEKFNESFSIGLKELKFELKPLLMNFVIFGGTLLGWYRQCGVIPYTTDIDYLAFSWDIDSEEQIVNIFKKNPNFKLEYLMGMAEEAFELSFYVRGIKTDLFFVYLDKEKFWISGHRSGLGYYFRYTYPMFEVCSAELLGYKVNVPCDPEAVLRAEYGPEWTKPVSDWTYDINPMNMGPRRYWPKEMLSRVYPSL